MAHKVGIIGCGNIAPQYFNALKKFSFLEIAACADMDVARAQARAVEFSVAKGCSVEDLLADPAIQTVVNLTIPKSHVEVGLKAVAAGKNAYCEKPLGLNRAEGKSLLDAAAKKKVRIGCAPDTVLGGGTQTCRKLIDDGAIGAPVGGSANMLCAGHESWHPDPAFYYKAGGGPMFDMGPYYIHSLVTLLGPVKRVSGSTRVTRPERTIASEPKKGQKITVDVPTHVVSILEFVNGAIVTLTTSFDVNSAHAMPNIEIYGTEGTIQVPDPNQFTGKVLLKKRGEQEWADIPHTHTSGIGRGIGVADMISAISSGREHRANGQLAFHALDIMQAIHESSDTGKHVVLTTTCSQPAPMKTGLPDGVLDEGAAAGKQ